ncbi:MFS general substrate transporter [Pyrenochaeta sp. DS3sAY3a]|nr:MFS general substrate transporter [Pyrenochaeta sp. DS3sAY3a]
MQRQSYTESTAQNAQERRLVRKIDLRVMPLLCLLYALSLIDRSIISAAKISGMAQDLKLTGNRYNVALLIFFIPYMLTEIPSNSIIRSVGTQRYLGSLIFCWGIVTMCFGFVHTFGQLVALRFLLGVFEGGFNPACIYLIASWYRRYEMQRRLAIWYVSGSLISGFLGIISYGLSRMEGVGGLRGWRWIYIIPGIVTVLLVVPVYLWITDFPEKANWLSPDELAMIRTRLCEDCEEDLEAKTTVKDIIVALSDWKVWAMGSFLFWPTAGAYTMSFFTPSILRGLGYNVALSQILVTPPYIAAAFASVATGYFADRVRLRTPFMIGHALVVIAGFVMIGWGNNTGSKLTGIFLAIIGNNCAIPAALAFLSNNVVGTKKRQTAIALQVMWGGLGGIVGSLISREQDYPTYRPGLYASFASMFTFIILSVGMGYYFHLENKKADKDGKVLEDIDGFRYTI